MFDGILPIYKERGITSHDVVFKARKILQMKKIGHSGTLDPEVDGVFFYYFTSKIFGCSLKT